MLRVHTADKPEPVGRKEVAAVPRETIHPLSALREEVDRLFEGFFAPMSRRMFDIDPLRWMEAPWATATGMMPRVDVTETADAYKVVAELPGLDDKDLDIAFADGILAIKGERKEEREEEDEAGRTWHVSECRYGSFQRSFRIPAAVREDDISARFEKGLLTVTLPKAEQAKPVRKIEVNRAEGTAGAEKRPAA